MSWLIALCLAVALAGCATPPTSSEATQHVRNAERTLANFQNDPEMAWFRNHVGKARAVIIVPQLTRAAFVLGGSGGEALVLARDKQGRWVGPAFYKIGAGSVGLQAGVDVAEVIMLVQSQKALTALLSRSVELGGDASVAAGPVGVGTTEALTADIVSFARSKGLYAGLSFTGTVVTPDDAANNVFYGKPVSALDVLERGNVNHAAAAPLQQSLGRLAK